MKIVEDSIRKLAREFKNTPANFFCEADLFQEPFPGQSCVEANPGHSCDEPVPGQSCVFHLPGGIGWHLDCFCLNWSGRVALTKRIYYY